MLVIFLLEINRIVFFVRKNFKIGTRKLAKINIVDAKILHSFANKLCLLKNGC